MSCCQTTQFNGAVNEGSEQFRLKKKKREAKNSDSDSYVLQIQES